MKYARAAIKWIVSSQAFRAPTLIYHSIGG
jgi:hypothetical protein